MIFLFFGLAIPICICDLKNLRIPNIYNLLIFYVSVINAVIFGFPEKDIVIKSGLIIGIFAIVGIGVGDLKLLGSVFLTTVNDPFTFLGFILVVALGHIVVSTAVKGWIPVRIALAPSIFMGMATYLATR
jgi:Flp pilus assembly protein protease CpaA